MKLAILYLVAIAGAEVVTNFPVLWKAIAGTEIVTNFPFLLVGIICHIIILTALIAHSSLAAESPSRKLLLALCLAPLTRIMSLSMPLAQFSPIYWYLIIYPPLFLAAWVAMRHLNFTTGETDLNARRLPLQLVVNRTGSLRGVTLSHGITNILLYLVIPFFI